MNRQQRERMRLVGIRLSEDECEKLRDLCATMGARSVSGLIRSTVRWLIANKETSLTEFVGASMEGRSPGRATARVRVADAEALQPSAADLVHLTAKLDLYLQHLSTLLEKIASDERRSHTG